MTCAARSNVYRLTPPALTPDTDLIAAYRGRSEAYLFACLTGATPSIIVERAEQMFLAREALRNRGISLKP